VPRSHVPQTGPHYYYVTIGWLLDGVASGRIPKPRVITPAGAATDNLRLSVSRYGRGYSAFTTAQADACVALPGGRSLPDIEIHLDTGQRIGIHHARVRLVPANGPADPALPLVLDGTEGSIATFAITDGTAFRLRPESVATRARICAPSSAFTDPTLTTPGIARKPDAPTFCSTAVDIQEFLADGTRKPRPETVRRNPKVLLPLLAKAQRSAPTEVAGAVDTFTQAVRVSMLTGKNQYGQLTVDDAVRNINAFMMNICGYPRANITGLD
jgi:hypothetical protein